MPKAELLELQAEGLGPLPQARLEFAPGFNVLTGETGSGKTLLIGALSLSLGASDVRGVHTNGSVRASALFRVDNNEVSFTRESTDAGRLRGSMDGLTVSAEALRDRSRDLIVIHGQHDSLRLRSRSLALALVDSFGAIDDGEYREVQNAIRNVEDQRKSYGGDAASREREIDFLRFQIREIDDARPTGPDELDDVLEDLRTRILLRDHHDDVLRALALIDGDEESTTLATLSQAVRLLPPEGAVHEIRDRFTSLGEEVRELVRDLRTLSDTWAGDEETIAALEDRAVVLQNLVRKFGGTLEEVLRRRRELGDELAKNESAHSEMATADERLHALQSARDELAGRLRHDREKAAELLARAVQGQFERVALARAKFQASVSGVDGSDVEFLFAPVPRTALQPLAQMASGGELARVLLAISLVTVSDGVVAVFDEVDAGIGGSVAQQIGECLSELSQRQQVIVVTHLASIASKADRHFVIERDDESSSTVRIVEGSDRVTEIARMLSGESNQDESRALADRMLSDAKGPSLVRRDHYNGIP